MLDELPWPAGLERRWQLVSGAVVNADAERLRRALINVINNALQAMEEKGGGDDQCLEITTRTSDGCCEIVVRDNGPGIAENMIDEIFYPMITTRADGSGLGLAITQAVIGHHGGVIECESHPGYTCFSVFLPLEAEEAPTTATTESRNNRVANR